MSQSKLDNPDRLHDLLADRAMQALSPEERTELDRLLGQHPEVDPLDFDRTAAALDLAMLYEEAEPLPDSVREDLERRAIMWLAESRGLSISGADATAAPTPALPAPTVRTFAFVPWLVAAASLLLALIVWQMNPSAPRGRALYDELVTHPAAKQVAWNDLGERGIEGDIVWDNDEQRGVMRFRGLEPNDVKRLQYQLWIFDEGRAELTDDGVPHHAVDGGVFDVTVVGDDVYVTVDAKLDVIDPLLFAITTEPPGGVVKHIDSGDFQIILTAPVEESDEDS